MIPFLMLFIGIIIGAGSMAIYFLPKIQTLEMRNSVLIKHILPLPGEK